MARSQRTLAEILEIRPHFKKNSPGRTKWVECSYSFVIKGNGYFGQSTLPLDYFIIPAASRAEPYVVYDARVDLPVLYYDGLRIPGIEAIEHYLLQRSDTLQISYLPRDPSRNFSVEKKEHTEERVK